MLSFSLPKFPSDGLHSSQFKFCHSRNTVRSPRPVSESRVVISISYPPPQSYCHPVLRLLPLPLIIPIGLHIEHFKFHPLSVQHASNSSAYPAVHGQCRRAPVRACSGNSRKLQRATFSDWCRSAGQLNSQTKQISNNEAQFSMVSARQ